VASIAFGVPVAVVDGNVERVLGRLLAHTQTVDSWTLAESLLERSRPGDWNQAMMELGATICLPRQPQCGQCPLRRWCKSSPRPATTDSRAAEKQVLHPLRPQSLGDSPAAPAFHGASLVLPQHAQPRRASGTPASARFSAACSAVAGVESPGGKPESRRAGSAAPGARRRRNEAYLLAQRGRSVYLVRRASREKLMAGMWELPRLPAAPSGREPLFRLKHSITVTDYEIAVFRNPKQTPLAGVIKEGDATSSTATLKNETKSSRQTPFAGMSDAAKPGGGRWVALKRVLELPLTGLTRKILRRAGLIQGNSEQVLLEEPRSLRG
jgi:adenine-specific DNA glycosylase